MKVVEEAGGVVVKHAAGVRHYLLVTAKRNAAHWLFPKGHIEPGESAGEAALREVQEEAGVDGAVAGSIGTFSFAVDGRQIRCQFFLIHYSRDLPAREPRERRWCTYEEAMHILTFEEGRQALSAARALVARSG